MRQVTLARTFRGWLGYTSPRLLMLVLTTAIAARLVIARWHVVDAVVAVSLVVLLPFVEWSIHVYVLHWRPRELFGRWVDPYASRSHRAHHRDPRNPARVFIDRRVLYVAATVIGALDVAAWRGSPAIATGGVTAVALLTAYEWTHFLIHSDYVPRTRVYRAVWRAHRLHHFRNEDYWYGVTSTVADRVLRTAPDRGAVPLSATARSLHDPIAGDVITPPAGAPRTAC